MGVESGRIALAGAPDGYEPGVLAFSTTSPAYADKTNATAVHAALGLPDNVIAVDAVGAVRSGVGATMMANAAKGLVVLSDVRTGRPGSADESSGGDGAVTLAFGDDGVIAEIIGGASVTAEFTDRWKAPGEAYAQVWEERFGESAYVPLAEAAVTAALKATGIALDDVDHVVDHRAPDPRRQGDGQGHRRPPRVGRRRPRQRRRQHRRRPLGAAARRRARPRRARPDDRPRAPRRRLRRLDPAHHRPAARRTASRCPCGTASPPRTAISRTRCSSSWRGLPRARAAAPARARSPGRPAVGPHRPLEVRVRRVA